MKKRLLAAPLFGAAWVTALTGRVDLAFPALTLGVVVGTLGALLLWLRGGQATFAKIFAVTVVVHAAFVMWAMADSPQLYASRFYDEGGLARTVQIFATDVLGTRGVVLVAIVFAIAFVKPSRLGRFLGSRAMAPALVLPVVALPDVAPPKTDAMSVVVIEVDSLRADRIDETRAPNLVRLAGKGTRFERAYATGRAPKLDVPFRSAGYAIAHVSDSAPTIDAPRPLAVLPILQTRLFSRIGTGAAVVSPAETAHEAGTAIRSFGASPFFLTVSLSATKAPNAVSAPYYAKYTDPKYRGRFKYGGPESVALDAADEQQLRGLYDGALSAADDAIGGVLGAIESPEKTVVVVTSNTGDDEGRVPLVVYDPRFGSRRESRVVRDVDLAPTLAELTGISIAHDAESRSLVPALRGGTLATRFACAELDPASPSVARRRTVRDEDSVLVYAPERTGVKYTFFGVDEKREALENALWSWMLADESMEKRDGYLVPRPPAPAYDVVWLTKDADVAEEGVRFTNAYAAPLGDAVTAILRRHAVPFGDVRAPFDPARTILVVTGTKPDADSRIALRIVAPFLPSRLDVADRVSMNDVAPTILEWLGLETPSRMPGKSLAALARGEKERDERPVVLESAEVRTLVYGGYRYVVHEKREALYDDSEPRRDLARARPDVVAEMRARLAAAVAGVPVAGSAEAIAAPERAPVVHFRFAGPPHRLSGSIRVAFAKSFHVNPVELGVDAFKIEADRIDVAFRSSPGVGFDLVVDPPDAAITWVLFGDDAKWPDDRVFAGEYGLASPRLLHGIVDDDARDAIASKATPLLDGAGLFVFRTR